MRNVLPPFIESKDATKYFSDLEKGMLPLNPFINTEARKIFPDYRKLVEYMKFGAGDASDEMTVFTLSRRYILHFFDIPFSYSLSSKVYLFIVSFPFL